jgi:hypothetical protein
MAEGLLTSMQDLANALYEQGESRAEAEQLAQVLLVLNKWQAPRPTAKETGELLERLLVSTPKVSPVREAMRLRKRGLWGDVTSLLGLVRAQASILRPAFWVTSAVIVLAGILLLLSGTNVNRAVVLQVIGPLLSYVGAANAFRGIRINTLEIELACPPSPRQLTIARLVIVLGYDIFLGLILSMILRTQGNGGIIMLTLHWLGPLFLVAGLSLFLSLRITWNHAASISYFVWLVFLTLSFLGQRSGGLQSMTSTLTGTAEWALGITGSILLLLAIGSIPTAVPRLLPRH